MVFYECVLTTKHATRESRPSREFVSPGYQWCLLMGEKKAWLACTSTASTVNETKSYIIHFFVVFLAQTSRP